MIRRPVRSGDLPRPRCSPRHRRSGVDILEARTNRIFVGDESRRHEQRRRAKVTEILLLFVLAASDESPVRSPARCCQTTTRRTYPRPSVTPAFDQARGCGARSRSHCEHGSSDGQTTGISRSIRRRTARDAVCYRASVEVGDSSKTELRQTVLPLADVVRFTRRSRIELLDLVRAGVLDEVPGLGACEAHCIESPLLDDRERLILTTMTSRQSLATSTVGSCQRLGPLGSSISLRSATRPGPNECRRASMTSSVGAKLASEPEHGASRAEKKVVIVTGASQGIGAGIAAAFTAAGYAVVGTALSVEPSATPDVLMVPGDIAQAETAELVVRQALDRFGRIDTLVNNAGIYIGKHVHRLHARRLRGDHVGQPHRVLPHDPAGHRARWSPRVEATWSMSAPVSWSTRTPGNPRPLPP